MVSTLFSIPSSLLTTNKQNLVSISIKIRFMLHLRFHSSLYVPPPKVVSIFFSTPQQPHPVVHSTCSRTSRSVLDEVPARSARVLSQGAGQPAKRREDTAGCCQKG